jgi:predicted metalloprotease with PDZ domain
MTVTEITAGGEAHGAGLQKGDTVLEINGKAAGQDSWLETARLQPGDTVVVKVRNRGGAERELRWKVGSREEVAYQLKDEEKVSAEQRSRRSAWLKGEAQPR